jgi:hypothetical protein
MKVFVPEFPKHTPEISYFHYLLFHGGQAPRPGLRPASPMFGDLRIWPLVLVHNARRIPPVFATDFNLVVSTLLADQLAELPHTTLRPVRFHRLVDYPPPTPGDHSYTADPAYQQAERNADGLDSIFDYLPDAPAELRAEVGRYFELIPGRLQDAAQHFTDARLIHCPRPDATDRVNELMLPATLVEAYPVTW